MNTREFWNLIETAGISEKEQNAQRSAIKQKLEQLADHDLEQFHDILCAKLDLCNTWNFVNAMVIIYGSVSDDLFLYWRGGLIMQGEKIFEDALQNVDSLVNCPDFEPDEDFLYLAKDIYKARNNGQKPKWTSLDSDAEGENPFDLMGGVIEVQWPIIQDQEHHMI